MRAECMRLKSSFWNTNESDSKLFHWMHFTSRRHPLELGRGAARALRDQWTAILFACSLATLKIELTNRKDTSASRPPST